VKPSVTHFLGTGIQSLRNHGKLYKSEALEVLFRPARLLDHALQRLALECTVPSVKGDRHAASVGMVKNLVRSVPAVVAESITDERRNHFSGGKIPKLSVVYSHGSDGDCNPRLDSDLHLIGRLRNRLAVLKHTLDNHMHHVIDVLERYFPGLAPR
jgi:hypothetical protein